MTTIYTIHGLKWTFDGQGWVGHDDDRDEAISNAVLHLETMCPNDDPHLIARRAPQWVAHGATSLHAGAMREDNDEGDMNAEDSATNELTRIAARAVRAVVADWHDQNAPALVIGAMA